jgi:hypothetical protein
MPNIDAPTDFSAGGRRLSDRQWRNLVTDIHDGQVAVVVGSELSAAGTEQPSLYQHLARELVRRLGLDDTRLPQRYGLLEVSNLFLHDSQNEAEDLFRETREALADVQWPISDSLLHLANIRDLNLFVSTTFDSLLEDALNQVRFDGVRRTRVLAYSEKAQLQDIDSGFDADPRPTVFHLFGKLNASGDYVLTEEKLLEFSYRLQSRDLRPPNLFDLLKAKHVWVLGCSLPGWLARFILRTTKGDVLLLQGARGSLVADRHSSRDNEFAMFLERRKVWPYSEGDAAHFVGELYRRWTSQDGAIVQQKQALKPEADTFRPDSVFVSYASEDYEAAVRVKQALDKAGVDVWFDKERLESGDSFRLVIEKNIERCSYFVPLISRNTIQMDKRFFRREWTKAIDEAAAWPEGYPFIQPLLIDDVSLSDPGIPEAFRQSHARRLADLDAFIADAKKRIRERRDPRRSG